MSREREAQEEQDDCEAPLLVGICEEEVDDRSLGPKNPQKALIEEMKRQVRLAGPLMSVSFLMYSVQVISVMFVGHLGKLPLSGASMATSFASVTGFSLLSCGERETDRERHGRHREADSGEAHPIGRPGRQVRRRSPILQTRLPRNQVQGRETGRPPPPGRPRRLRSLRAPHSTHHRRHRASPRKSPNTRPEMPNQRPRQPRLLHRPRRRLQEDVVPYRELHRRRLLAPPRLRPRRRRPRRRRGGRVPRPPPIAANEPILCLIWEQIATLHKGSLDDRSDAAASLVSLARDNDRYGKLILEEGGVAPLLKLVKEGKLEGQENAARAIGLLGRDTESVDHMIHAGVCSAFAKALKEGHMKVQGMVAWAVSELAANQPKCQDLFAQNNIIRLLVSQLAFETVQEHSKYAVVASNNNNNSKSSMSSIHSVLMANAKTQVQVQVQVQDEDGAHIPPRPNHRSNSINNSNVNAPVSLSGGSIKGREFEDPKTKANAKAMAAKALWQLAKGNAGICRSITESKALLCLAVLLEKGPPEVQYNSAMALMEITAVGEENPDLRRSAFKPNSPAAKAVFDQLLRVIEKAEYSELLIPCVQSMGNLARTFRATETRIIGPLVQLLDEREAEVAREAAIALTKFACAENYLHVDHSKAIINAGGVKHLIQLLYFGEQIVQIPSLVLLCYIALNVPDSEALAQAEALTVLEWASKQSYMVQEPSVDAILAESKSRLELYQSRGSRGFH
ncbi:hypothetical protein Scep_002562 [Stephania cephalantha]|uniref:Uncharacterized protein n=1 Tax=Stephania cephalantha TaxID=152367 RepID=A0AAP0LAG0_9MAGN